MTTCTSCNKVKQISNFIFTILQDVKNFGKKILLEIVCRSMRAHIQTLFRCSGLGSKCLIDNSTSYYFLIADEPFLRIVSQYLSVLLSSSKHSSMEIHSNKLWAALIEVIQSKFPGFKWGNEQKDITDKTELVKKMVESIRSVLLAENTKQIISQRLTLLTFAL